MFAGKGRRAILLAAPSITRCEASDSPDCGVGNKAQDDKNGQCDEHPDYDRRTIASATPSILNARTAQTAIKAMPTASRVAATSTAKRLNCRNRVADRRLQAAYRAAAPRVVGRVLINRQPNADLDAPPNVR